MSNYYFWFGFMEPNEVKHLGTLDDGDYESSEGIYIAAGSEEEALKWGKKIAEAFIKVLFQDEKVSWEKQRFASGVDPSPEKHLDPEAIREAPRIRAGEFPNIPFWIEQREKRIKRGMEEYRKRHPPAKLFLDRKSVIFIVGLVLSILIGVFVLLVSR